MKAKMILLLICLILILLMGIQAPASITLQELNNPDSIKVGNGFLYVQEKTTIYLYSVDSGAFIKTFGREGEAPGELKINPFGMPMIVSIQDSRVYVSCLAKLAVFSRIGDFLTEYRVNSMDTFFPFAEKYVCLTMVPREDESPEMVPALFLADENLKKQRILYKTDFKISQNADMEFPITPFDPFVYRDRLYIVEGIQGFAIGVYDLRGDKLFTIHREIPRLKVSSSYREKTLEWFKTDNQYKQIYELLKNRIAFKTHYPPVHALHVAGDAIFVTTHALKQGRRECIVLDLQGNEMKRIFLPIPEQFGLDFRTLFTFSDDTFYWLEENDASETWVLKMMKI